MYACRCESLWLVVCLQAACGQGGTYGSSPAAWPMHGRQTCPLWQAAAVRVWVSPETRRPDRRSSYADPLMWCGHAITQREFAPDLGTPPGKGAVSP